MLRSQFFEYSRETLYKHALEYLEEARPEKKRSSKKKGTFFFLPTVNAWLLLTSLKARDWSGHIFGASAGPRSFTKKLAMSSSSTVHGGQHDTKQYVTFELLYCVRIHGLTKFGVLRLNQLVLYNMYSCICCWYRGIHSWTIPGLSKHGLHDDMRHRKQKQKRGMSLSTHHGTW